MNPRKASAIAGANVALVKYWGKRNESLVLPYNSSISVTLADFRTHTTVEAVESLVKDEIILNGKPADSDTYQRVEHHLDWIAGSNRHRPWMRVVSHNDFPTGVGIASSASGFAALTVAASLVLQKYGEAQTLSKMARRGSGSACRSVFGGFVEWKRGQREDGEDSFAEPVAGPDHWPDFRIVVAVVDRNPKIVSSRAGMRESVRTSPYYSAWVKTCEEDVEPVRQGIREKRLDVVGSTAELNCLKMHAVMMTTNPPIVYFQPQTVEIMHQVRIWRSEGLFCYFTIDAGPQVKILTLAPSADVIHQRLCQSGLCKQVVVSRVGGPACQTESHLL